MQTVRLKMVCLAAGAVCAILLWVSSWAAAQEKDNLTPLMVKSYDLLEAGKLDEAQKIYEQVLKEDPGNPLALNNLATIMVKKGRTAQALAYLNQALPKAKGYKVMVNRVCEVNGVCLAFRPLEAVYGNQELEPLIRLNIRLLQGKAGGPPGGK